MFGSYWSSHPLPGLIMRCLRYGKRVVQSKAVHPDQCIVPPRTLMGLDPPKSDVSSDVRSSPYSKYATQFDRESLLEALRAAGFQYVYLGSELGGRPRGDAYYDATWTEWTAAVPGDVPWSDSSGLWSGAGDCLAPAVRWVARPHDTTSAQRCAIRSGKRVSSPVRTAPATFS